MKRSYQWLCLLLTLVLSTAAFSADPEKKRKNKKKDHISINLEGLDDMMHDLETQLEDLEFQFDNFSNIHFELNEAALEDLSVELQQLEDLDVQVHGLDDLHVSVPSINISIPPMPFIPPIDIQIPEINIDGHDFNFEWHHGDYSDFDDLTEAEEVRRHALRSVVRKTRSEEKSLDALAKVLHKDDSPALRYEALRQLENYLDNKRAISLLEKAARYDNHVKVRKKAIRLLGKSGDPRAVEILEEIIRD